MNKFTLTCSFSFLTSIAEYFGKYRHKTGAAMHFAARYQFAFPDTYFTNLVLGARFLTKGFFFHCALSHFRFAFSMCLIRFGKEE